MVSKNFKDDLVFLNSWFKFLDFPYNFHALVTVVPKSDNFDRQISYGMKQKMFLTTNNNSLLIIYISYIYRLLIIICNFFRNIYHYIIFTINIISIDCRHGILFCFIPYLLCHQNILLAKPTVRLCF